MVLQQSKLGKSRLFACVSILFVTFAFFRLCFNRQQTFFKVQPPILHSYEDAPLIIKESLIPARIWQIFLPTPTNKNAVVDSETLKDTTSWLAKNPDYTYTLMRLDGGNRFVQEHFGKSEKVINTWNSLKNPGLKSDFLRYLVLYIYGGIYTDIDTEALKPIDQWVPADLRDSVKLIVGIEWDSFDGGAWVDIPHDLQFCQWTIAAAPGHPVFLDMIERAIDSLEKLVVEHKTTLDRLHPSSFEVMNSTGPSAWTDVVFKNLQEREPTLTKLKDLTLMTQPKLYGDMLILSIDGFGMGQDHSKSTNDGSIPDAAFLKHNFRGSWRDS
jgi:alpha 1,6-mannosyltransferase